MTNTNQAMGVKASFEGIKKIQQRMAELVRPDNQEKKGWTQLNLADRSGVDLSTVKRFLKGNPIRPDFLSYIAQAVGLSAEDLIERPLTDLQERELDWLVICGEALDKQRDANQLRRQATGLGAENNVYMPLDLVETRETTSANNQNKSGNKKETEEVIYPHAQFLEYLLNWQRKNKHIAIAGEAGAGKTTFLVTIAEKLKNSQYLPIFIGLADLQGRSLKTYINDVWLPYALNERQATEEQKESLFQQFQAGKIWLLLDALDEMQATSSAKALDKINREIKEIIGQSRVMMTCRLNVWDAYINRLPNFDTFRMGNLSLEQIDSFISQWFSFTACPENAAILQEKLKEPNRDRIRDMVRHPLRLALLCQAFYRNPNTDLPETKAGLYMLFVRYFYEWKPNIVDVDLRTQDSLREELHQALGKLAIAGIDSDAGFRLSRIFAVKAMGNSDLFNLACKVGWLSLIERNERDEEVYSFFHTTFQEYFAALAIDDWDFFLPHKHRDKPLAEQKYRIFEPQWRYCFLLWIGRENSASKDSKQEIVERLWKFEDNCLNIYSRKAKCLAVAATGELIDCTETLLQSIIKTTLNAAFGGFLSGLVRESATASLLEANSIKVLEVFLSLIQKGEISEVTKEDILRYFIKYWKQNKEAVDLLNRNGIELVEPKIRMMRLESAPTPIEHEEYYDELADQDYIDALNEQYFEVGNLINNAKNEESLIDFYESNPTHPHYDSIINEVVSQYAESSRSINFIITTVLFPVGECMMFLGCECPIAVSLLANRSEPLPEKLSLAIVNRVGQYLLSGVVSRDTDREYYSYYYNLLWKCSESLNYHDFYEALYKPLAIHPEVADSIPMGDVNIFNKLECQFIDFNRIKIELDVSNSEIRCLVVDICQLEQESDSNVIAEEIGIRIFDSLGHKIPEIQRVSSLKRELLNLKFDLGSEKLAIALYGAGDNQAISKFCHDLAIPSIEIRLFGIGQSTEQIVTQIKAWLSEI